MCSIQSRWSWAIYKIAQWYVVSMMKWRLRVWLPALAIFSFLFLFCNSSFTTWHNVISCNGRTRIMPRAIRVRHAHQVPHAPYSFHIFLREIIFPCDPICPDPWCKCLYHHNKNHPPSPPFSGVLDITRIGFTMQEKAYSDGHHLLKVTGIAPVTSTASLFRTERWRPSAHHLCM